MRNLNKPMKLIMNALLVATLFVILWLGYQMSQYDTSSTHLPDSQNITYGQ